MESIKQELNAKIKGALAHLTSEFSTIRSSGANAGMLDKVTVEVYGQRLPLNQVATISVPDPRQILIQLWDKSNAGAMEKAVLEADLGLGVTNEGERVRISVPPLSDERRDELVRLVHKLAEEARVSIRGVRREAIEAMERKAANGGVSDDDKERLKKEYQILVDQGIAEVDQLVERKSADLKSI